PAVAEVNFFGFYDDGLRTGFQAGLYRADGTPRPAAEAVRQAIADTAGGCAGHEGEWTPAEGVSGAAASGVGLTGLFGPVPARRPRRGGRRPAAGGAAGPAAARPPPPPSCPRQPGPLRPPDHRSGRDRSRREASRHGEDPHLPTARTAGRALRDRRSPRGGGG